MQTIYLDTQSDYQLPKLAMTIGNFDGVHKGHQAIIERLQNTARAKELKTAVMLFDPQPKEYFAVLSSHTVSSRSFSSNSLSSSSKNSLDSTFNDNANDNSNNNANNNSNNPHSPKPFPTRISSTEEKLALLSQLNLDYAFVCRFDDGFKSQTAQEFSQRLKQLNVQHIMVGDDFKFGHDRSGDSQFLKDFGFELDKMETLTLSKERISSTRIRECLAAGDFISANKLLGRRYHITGNVEQGDQIGRTIDFPTANVALNRMRPCLHGIYGVEVTGVDCNLLDVADSSHRGVSSFSPNSLFGAAHVGTRPAIKDKPPEWRLEINFPKFKGNLYGLDLQVTFLHFLHGEKNYASLTELKTGIAQDVQDLLSWREKQTRHPLNVS